MKLDFNKIFPIVAVVIVLLLGGWVYYDLSKITSWLYPPRETPPAVQVVVVDPPIVAPVPHDPPAPRLTGIFVQLASYRDKASADAALKSFSSYSDLFDSSALKVYISSLPNGKWYRIVLKASSAAKATTLCQSIKSRGGDCFVLTIN